MEMEPNTLVQDPGLLQEALLLGYQLAPPGPERTRQLTIFLLGETASLWLLLKAHPEYLTEAFRLCTDVPVSETAFASLLILSSNRLPFPEHLYVLLGLLRAERYRLVRMFLERHPRYASLGWSPQFAPLVPQHSLLGYCLAQGIAGRAVPYLLRHKLAYPDVYYGEALRLAGEGRRWLLLAQMLQASALAHTIPWHHVQNLARTTRRNGKVYWALFRLGPKKRFLLEGWAWLKAAKPVQAGYNLLAIIFDRLTGRDLRRYLCRAL